MLSDNWLSRYRLLENFITKWNGNRNTYDRDDYNSYFALRAVELKMSVWMQDISCSNKWPYCDYIAIKTLSPFNDYL